MDPTFGSRLRQQRERQQVPLSAIAEQTKIKASLLDGLERDDLSRWPGGIFRRSYVRAYAEAIGLEPDSVVREFLALHPDPDDDVPAMAAVARAVDNDPNRRPPTRLGNLISSAIGSWPALRSSPGTRNGLSGSPSTTAASHDRFRMDGGFTDASQHTGWPEPAMTPVSKPEAEMSGEPAADVSFRQPEVDIGDPIHTAAATRQTEEELPDTLERSPQAPDPLVDLRLVAELCTRLSRATDAGQIAPVLADMARMLDAVGLMLWTWHGDTGQLAPALVHGYQDSIVAQLPGVSPEDDNAIAWAFRSEETRTISGSDLATGALAVPLMSPAGCTGVLALELRHGHEQHGSVRAVAEIVAAQLSALVGHQPASDSGTGGGVGNGGDGGNGTTTEERRDGDERRSQNS